MEKLLLEELKRMLELAGVDSKKKHLNEQYKPNSSNKKIIKEQEEGDEFEDLFVGLEEEPEKPVESLSPAELPLQMKVAILSNSVNDYHAKMWNIHGKIETERKIKQGEEEGAIVSRVGRIVPKEMEDAYHEMLSKGRKVATFFPVGTDRELSEKA